MNERSPMHEQNKNRSNDANEMWVLNLKNGETARQTIISVEMRSPYTFGFWQFDSLMPRSCLQASTLRNENPFLTIEFIKIRDPSKCLYCLFFSFFVAIVPPFFPLFRSFDRSHSIPLCFVYFFDSVNDFSRECHKVIVFSVDEIQTTNSTKKKTPTDCECISGCTIKTHTSKLIKWNNSRKKTNYNWNALLR